MGYNLEAVPNTSLSQTISKKIQQVFWGQKSRV
jgi:hypothetical protein